MTRQPSFGFGRYWLFFLLGAGSVIAALSATLWSADTAYSHLERAQRDVNSATATRSHVDFLKFRQTAQQAAMTPTPSAGSVAAAFERFEILVARVRSIRSMVERANASEEERRACETLDRFVVEIDALLAERGPPAALIAAMVEKSAPLEPAFQIIESGMTARGAAARAMIHGQAQDAIRDTRSLVIFCAVVTFVFSAALLQSARQLEAKNRRLSALSARLRAVAEYRSQFLANASHEFRTPLNAIKGFAQSMLYLGDTLPTPRRREYLDDIVHSAGNLERLTEDLLDLAKVDAGKYELREALAGLDELAARAARGVSGMASSRGVTLEIEAHSGLSAVCDASAIERCVINLLTNAVKFSEPGAVVRLSTRAEGGDGVIEVADQGCGIPEDQIDAIWEFYGRSSLTRQNDKQGTGLGLPISRAIVEAHGGVLAARSRVGEGSVFTLSLPARRMSRMAPPEAQTQAKTAADDVATDSASAA